MTYIDDSKYKQFVADMDSHFSRAKITNFDLINHHCRGDKLKNSRGDCKTIFDNDFKNYEDHGGYRSPLKRSVTVFISRAVF